MSGGRLLVGVGPADPDSTRPCWAGRRCPAGSEPIGSEEFVTLLDLLLRQPSTHLVRRLVRSGRGADHSRIRGSEPRPPLVVAGNGPRGVQLALRIGDGWVTKRSRRTTEARVKARECGRRGVAEVAPPIRRRRRRRRDAGGLSPGSRHGLRDGRSESLEQMRDHLGRAEALGFTDVVIAWPRDSEPLRGSTVCAGETGRPRFWPAASPRSRPASTMLNPLHLRTLSVVLRTGSALRPPAGTWATPARPSRSR